MIARVSGQFVMRDDVVEHHGGPEHFVVEFVEVTVAGDGIRGIQT
jgi:hypothetical protein